MTEGGARRVATAPMARSQANENFALTSFLYGGNADYIDELYARYEKDPASVEAEWGAFFKELKDEKRTRPEERRRPVLEPGELADRR